jgi:multidrug efflux pump subunit AcrB
MIAWFAANRVAANLMMLLVIIAGALAMTETRKELIPNISLDLVLITVPYPGAAPEEVERGVCIRVEEKIFDIEGIRELTAIAREDACIVTAEVEPEYETREVMDDIKARIDTITNFPKDSEQPVVQERTIRASVADIVVAGDIDELSLKRLAEEVRDELTSLPSITQVDLINARPYEISIEVSEQDLKRYGLSFDEVAQAVNQASLDLPGGLLKTDSGEVHLRTIGQAYWGEQYEKLVLRATPDGGKLLVNDVANVVDGFAETEFSGELNGKRGIMMTVFRVGDQNILQIADDIYEYIAYKQTTLPPNIELVVWNDRSKLFKSRMTLLTKNAITGLLLVFLLLVMFLRFRLAFWVSLGIPISFMGAFMLLPQFDASINMISMFAFILVLGIVVDDAIVVGENVHSHQQAGQRGLQGAIAGTQEVAKPVVFAVLTSVVAFMPILFLPGPEGRLWMVIPMVVIITLLFSLWECLFVLPAHLSTIHKESSNNNLFGRLQQKVARGVEDFVTNVYRPFLVRALHWRYATLATFLAGLMVFAAIVAGGWLHVLFFPKVEGDIAVVSVSFPQGTSIETTAAAVDRIENAANELKRDLREREGREQVVNMISVLGLQPAARTGKEGAHVAEVELELAPAEDRKLSSSEIVKLWRQRVGDIPGATQLSFESGLRNPGPGISIQLSGANMQRLTGASEALQEYLKEYPGLFDIQDSFETGKREVRLRLKPGAQHLGVNTQLLARQVRQAFYGEEIQRIQRGRDDVRVFVRYPEQQRESLFALESMFIRLTNGVEIPLLEVADLEYGFGPAEIRRIDRKRIVEVTAQVDEARAVPGRVMTDLQDSFLQRLPRMFPGVSWGKSGQQQERDELTNAMINGFILAMFGIYLLMAVPFRSYTQPLMVMSAIPFGLIGAIIGHIVLGLDISLLSLSGMIAVAGVVVNDNLVLVDYINRFRRDGRPLTQAIRDAGAARFRPIILTSLTTFAGLTPLMLERSVQAQFLIPMAVSLAFGVMFATVVSLVLVPASYYILDDMHKALSRKA